MLLTLLASIAISSATNLADQEKTAVNKIQAATDISPVGWLKESVIRQIWSNAYPELHITWAQAAPDVSVPIYPKDKLGKVLSVMNQTEGKPELTVPDYASLTQNGNQASIISLDGKYISVEQYPTWDYSQALDEFSAPSTKYNFVPSNNTLGTQSLLAKEKTKIETKHDC